MTIIHKKRLAASALCLAWALLAVTPVLATPINLDPTAPTSNYGLKEVEGVKVGKKEDLKDTIANIINVVLGFLGVIAVVLIIYGGFKWMTAGGNEESVKEARSLITQAVIGLVIIFAAYILASFIISSLREATDVRS